MSILPTPGWVDAFQVRERFARTFTTEPRVEDRLQEEGRVQR
jgi:hypothetical protein